VFVTIGISWVDPRPLSVVYLVPDLHRRLDVLGLLAGFVPDSVDPAPPTDSQSAAATAHRRLAIPAPTTTPLRAA